MKKNKEEHTENKNTQNDAEQPLDKSKEVHVTATQTEQEVQDEENTVDQPLETEPTEKEEIIEKLNLELEKTRETVLRKVAEFDNLKKRVQKEKSQIFQDSKIAAVESFLPIRDDLKRSLEAFEQAHIDKGFLEGIQMVAGKFEKVLGNLGVTPIDDEMVPFDVDVHDALLRQPSDDNEIEPNTVIKVIEPGYKIENRVIKHAKVIVSQ